MTLSESESFFTEGLSMIKLDDWGSNERECNGYLWGKFWRKVIPKKSFEIIWYSAR